MRKVKLREGGFCYNGWTLRRYGKIVAELDVSLYSNVYSMRKGTERFIGRSCVSVTRPKSQKRNNNSAGCISFVRDDVVHCFVSFNRVHLSISPADFYDTIAHEIAHAMTSINIHVKDYKRISDTKRALVRRLDVDERIATRYGLICSEVILWLMGDL